MARYENGVYYNTDGSVFDPKSLFGADYQSTGLNKQFYATLPPTPAPLSGNAPLLGKIQSVIGSRDDAAKSAVFKELQSAGYTPADINKTLTTSFGQQALSDTDFAFLNNYQAPQGLIAQAMPTPPPTQGPMAQQLWGVTYDGKGPDLNTINSLYLNILGRSADAEGLGFYDKEDRSEEQIRAELMDSAEYRSKGGNTVQQPTPAPTAVPIAAQASQQPVGQTTTAPNPTSVPTAAPTPTTDYSEALRLQARRKAELDLQNQAVGRGDDTESFLQKGQAALDQQFGPVDRQLAANQIRQAIANGEDLNQFYGDRYDDSLRLLEDLGVNRGGKDAQRVLDASPTGYSGAWKFDPTFGSDYYKQYAQRLGESLGLSEAQIRKAAGEYANQTLYNPNNKGFDGGIGDPRFLTGMASKLIEASGQNPLRPEFSLTLQKAGEFAGTVSKGLYSESDSSGVFKQVAQGLNKALGPIDDIIVGAIGLATGQVWLGPAYTGVTTTAATGDIKSGLKAGALSAIGSAVAPGVNSAISGALTNAGVTNGIVNGALAGAGTGALVSGGAAAITGGDVGDAVTKGLIAGGLSGGFKGAGGAKGSGATVGGIDDSSADLGVSMNIQDSLQNGAYSALDGPAADNPANRLDTAIDKVQVTQGIDRGRVSGIDDSKTDLGRTLDSQDSQQSGSYSGLDGGAGDSPNNRVDLAAEKVANSTPGVVDRVVGKLTPTDVVRVVDFVANGSPGGSSGGGAGGGSNLAPVVADTDSIILDAFGFNKDSGSSPVRLQRKGNPGPAARLDVNKVLGEGATEKYVNKGLIARYMA